MDNQFPDLSSRPINAIFPDRVKAVSEGICPLPDCRKEIKMEDFKDEISRREYRISGMCQSCQDKVFAEPEE